MKDNLNICTKLNVIPLPPDINSIIGIAINSFGKGREIHGLRHPQKVNTNGWYIWEGDYSEKDDFFSPICIKHLERYVDIKIENYLELPPGFRFLIDRKGYEDIWFDENLLKT